MRKTKKSLAVLLAALMLASFMPLFASAEAITINRNNVKIVPPSVSPAVIEYGQTLADVTLSGGECWYVDPDTGAETLVPGHFEVRSTTTKPSVSDAYNIPLRFYSDDTTQYSNISLLSATTATIKSGTWPTLKVNGLDGVLVEAPTAADILTGQMLGEATLSGGIVNGVDGNPLTGYWEYVYPASYPTESGKYEVQFTATGYNALKTTVDVKVTSNGNATIAEAPVAKRTLLGKALRNVNLIGGKVVDENGAEITTGYWSWLNDATQSTTTIFDTAGTKTFKAQWTALGYPVIIADIQVFVAEDMGYTVDKPSLVEEVPYVTGLTYGTLPFVYGEASVPGTYSVSNADTKLTRTSTTKTYNATLTFTPDDALLDSTSWTYTFKVVDNAVWQLPEYPEKIVLPYGYAYNSISKFSPQMPQEFIDFGLNALEWDTSEFNAADHDAGYIQLVKVKISHNSNYYKIVYDEIYIQIEPRVHEGDFCEISNMNPDKITGETLVTIKCDIPGITGKIEVKANGETFATLTPDENGYVYEKVTFIPKTSGDYTFSATYIPDTLDKTTIVNTEVTGNTVNIDIPELRKLTVYVANQKFEYDVYETYQVNHSWADFSSDPHADVFDHWVVTDGNGNEVTVENLDPKKPHLQFVMPEHDLVLTAKGEIEDMTASDGSLGSTLWNFWQKLVNFIVEIYRTIVDFFVPAMENI